MRKADFTHVTNIGKALSTTKRILENDGCYCVNCYHCPFDGTEYCASDMTINAKSFLHLFDNQKYFILHGMKFYEQDFRGVK